MPGKNRRTSIIGCFFFAVFHMFQMAAIYVIVLALVDGSTSPAPAWQALGLLLVSIIGRAVVNRFTQLQQTHAGYFMVANKRIAIGDKLKRVPMGYFNDKSLGELTGITTTVLDDVENTGPRHGRSERTLRLQQNFIFLCRRRGGSLQLYLHRRQLHMQRCCANQHETAQYYCHNTGNSGLSSESYFLFIYSTLDTSFLDYAAHASTNAPQILR